MAEASSSKRPPTASPSSLQTPLAQQAPLDDVTPKSQVMAPDEDLDADAAGEDDEEHAWYNYSAYT